MILDLAAREEERVWVKRQTDGELDDSRLTEGLTGEATVYKRRGMAKPELGRPQLKYVTVSHGLPSRSHSFSRQAEEDQVPLRCQRFNVSPSDTCPHCS